MRRGVRVRAMALGVDGVGGVATTAIDGPGTVVALLGGDMPFFEEPVAVAQALTRFSGQMTRNACANHATVARMFFNWFDHPLSEGWLEARLRAELYRQHALSRQVSL